MQYMVAILLAVIQGLTEFIPVSSSGHLAITQFFLGFSEPPVAFDVILHVGTLFAVLLFYRTDLIAMLGELRHPGRLFRPDWKTENPGKLIFLLILACIPTAIMGFLLKSRVEHAFSDVQYVACGFILSGAIMALTLRRKNGAKTFGEMSAQDALLIGTMQGVALFPGVSRSGSTISAALLLGMQPATAGRFSFLLSIPAILGATLLESKSIETQLHSGQLLLYSFSGAIAGIVGYLSIRPLLRILQASRFHYFSFYCWIIGISLLVYVWQTTT